MKNLALVLLVCLAGVAQGAKNPALSAYAKQRPRDAKGHFMKVAPEDRAAHRPMAVTGLANPSNTGKTTLAARIVPATTRKAGSLKVTLPDHYRSNSKAGSSQRELVVTDIRGETHFITGTLAVGPTDERSPFAPATFTAQIPAGIVLSARGVKQGLTSAPLHGLETSMSVATK